MDTEIKITADGSGTLYVPALNEHYHSTNGAVQESMHVFIKAGLYQLKTRNPAIFEIGFGTGLNTLLTYLEMDRFEHISYSAIEMFPVEWGKIDNLSYPGFLKLKENEKIFFEKIHKSDWNDPQIIDPKFQFTKFNASMIEFQFNNEYDLIYFDAFAPAVQPELWEESVFQKIFVAMNQGGILVTYCAKGEVRRNLQHCGFVVERLPGPPGKREMIRATKL
jgi:tRNA U34 5-methylaminomethyl-2-thiouridine-forming methyltransferase MnmC